MDRKWFPDFVRSSTTSSTRSTQKVLVRELKRVHFDPGRVPDPLFFRERGDTAYKPFTATDWERLRAVFQNAERLELLER